MRLDLTKPRAAWEGAQSCTVKLLLREGAQVDLKDNAGRTPLSYAAGRGHKAIVNLLLKEGAVVNLVDGLGQSPLSYAVRRGTRPWSSSC